MNKLDVLACYDRGLERATIEKRIAFGLDTDINGPEMDELRGLVWQEIKEAGGAETEGLDKIIGQACNLALVTMDREEDGADSYERAAWTRRVVVLDRLRSEATAKARGKSA